MHLCSSFKETWPCSESSWLPTIPQMLSVRRNNIQMRFTCKHKIQYSSAHSSHLHLAGTEHIHLGKAHHQNATHEYCRSLTKYQSLQFVLKTKSKRWLGRTKPDDPLLFSVCAQTIEGARSEVLWPCAQQEYIRNVTQQLLSNKLPALSQASSFLRLPALSQASSFHTLRQVLVVYFHRVQVPSKRCRQPLYSREQGDIVLRSVVLAYPTILHVSCSQCTGLHWPLFMASYESDQIPQISSKSFAPHMLVSIRAFPNSLSVDYYGLNS